MQFGFGLISFPWGGCGSPWPSVQDVPPLCLSDGGPEGDAVLPGGPELLHVDLRAGGEDEGDMTEEGGWAMETDSDQRAGVILELVTDLETFERN